MYVDATGKLDGTGCLLEWKTTSSRYPEQPSGLLALDPQLVCYSRLTGISEMAQVVFVKKRLVEVQYLRTTITDEQRREFGQLVGDTIDRMEGAQFPAYSGIRFPQNPCTSCPMWACVWGAKNGSMLLWYDAQELNNLVGLRSLHFRYPSVLPKLNQRRALFVLTKTDEIFEKAGNSFCRSAGQLVFAIALMARIILI